MSALETIRRNAARVRRVGRRRGLVPVARDCAGWVVGYTAGRRRPVPDFDYDGRTYRGLHHPYHYTWLNERQVEIPVFAALVGAHDPGQVLEVGNVLVHYGEHRHAVVDRYEQADRVVNVDIVDYDPGRRFDLIVAISTLEHVGLDEDVHEPGKPARAIEHLRGLLAPAGKLVVSVPVDYNPDLDRMLRDGEVPLDSCHALRRVGGRWRQVDCADAWDATYDELLYRAEAVVIATASPAAP